MLFIIIVKHLKLSPFPLSGLVEIHKVDYAISLCHRVHVVLIFRLRVYSIEHCIHRCFNLVTNNEHSKSFALYLNKTISVFSYNRQMNADYYLRASKQIFQPLLSKFMVYDMILFCVWTFFIVIYLLFYIWFKEHLLCGTILSFDG